VPPLLCNLSEYKSVSAASSVYAAHREVSLEALLLISAHRGLPKPAQGVKAGLIECDRAFKSRIYRRTAMPMSAKAVG